MPTCLRRAGAYEGPRRRFAPLDSGCCPFEISVALDFVAAVCYAYTNAFLVIFSAYTLDELVSNALPVFL